VTRPLRLSERHSDDLTRLVEAASSGDRDALSDLMPIVYDELRAMAARYLRRERPGQTLQATALVHDVYLRLLKDRKLSWQSRAHFFAIAAHSMREILIDRARARRAQKRGGDPVRVTLDAAIASPPASFDFEALDAALTKLATIDPEQARIVEVRFFGGLTIEETAEALAMSPATVKRRWSIARAWLFREITGSRA
jgi:RNA polymerase sigma factor (TIGR02999 family)